MHSNVPLRASSFCVDVLRGVLREWTKENNNKKIAINN